MSQAMFQAAQIMSINSQTLNNNFVFTKTPILPVITSYSFSSKPRKHLFTRNSVSLSPPVDGDASIVNFERCLVSSPDSSLPLASSSATFYAFGATQSSLQKNRVISLNTNSNKFGTKLNWAIQMGVLAISQKTEPAMAVTGVNNEEDLIWILLKIAVVAFGYFLIMPPIIMNWLRIRWYKRNLLEMYVQFMFVFIFFPGILVWAPFLNFRKFPRDPTLKYPWSKPENPSAVKGGFRKFPWATIKDYDL